MELSTQEPTTETLDIDSHQSLHNEPAPTDELHPSQAITASSIDEPRPFIDVPTNLSAIEHQNVTTHEVTGLTERLEDDPDNRLSLDDSDELATANGKIPAETNPTVDNLAAADDDSSEQVANEDSLAHSAAIIADDLDTGNSKDEDSTSKPLPTVILHFQQYAAMSLFPPATEYPSLQDFVNYNAAIQDNKIAYKRLDQLFAALRQGLSSTVSDDDELCLSIPQLGLTVHEVSLPIH